MRLPPLSFGLATLLLGSAAAAAPVVTVLDLEPGGCLGTGEVVEGPPAGGEFLPPPVDVPVRVRLGNLAGAGALVTLAVDGAQVAQQAVPAGGAEPVEVALPIPFEAVADGPGKVLVVEATAGGETTRVELVVELDRAAPSVVFAEADLEAQGTCVAAPPPLNYQVADAQDPAPQVRELDQVVGCERRRVVEATDRCGNGQRTTYLTVQAPEQAPQVEFLGVQNGDSLPLARVSWRVNTGEGCVVGERGELERDGGAAQLLFPGEPIAEPGDYVARVTLDTCGPQPVVGAVDFTVTGGAVADPGGPYLVSQGTELTLDATASSVPPGEGAIVEYAWDMDGDGFFTQVEPRGALVPFDTTVDGAYTVGLRITTDTGYADFGEAQVVVEDVDPVCAAGGPYTIEQGRPLTVDGRGTAEGHPVEPLLLLDWDFGDDRFPQRGLNREPVHRYLDEGDFTITLTAADRDSEVSCQAQVTVLDVEPEIRGLAAVDAEGLLEGAEVRFTAGRTSAGSDAEPLIRFAWTFGDGESAEGPDVRGPSHIYDDSGEFEVCLQVEDPDSAVQDCIQVVVADLAPIARLEGPGFAREGQAVTFSALGSTAGGEADPLSRYEWDFGDGSPPVVVRDLAQTEVEHVFQDDGPTTVTLRVHDEDSFTERTLALFVEDARPRADLVIRAGLTVPEGQLIPLDGRGSAAGAPSDPIVAYAWEFGDGSTADGPDLAQVEHRWPDQGRFEVRLVVIDADGSRASAQRFVEVTNVPPRNLTITGPGVVEVGAEATWRAEYQDAQGDTGRVAWRLGDGREVNGRSTVSHTYSAPGFYTQRVTVDDGDGGVSRVDRVIQVTVAAPRLEGPATLEGVESSPLTFSVTARPARQGAGDVDGPLAFRLVAGPDGLSWAADEGEGVDALVEQRLDFAWTPGPADAGEHLVRVVARAPSGTERAHEVRITVSPQGDARLLAATADGRLLVHAWGRDPLRDRVTFTPLAELYVGRARALAVDPRRGLAVGAVTGAGAYVVVDLRASPPRVARRINAEGAPVAVTVGAAFAFGVDDRGEVCALDLDTLKMEGHVRSEALRGAVDVALLDPVAVPGLQASTVLVLTADGRLAALPEDDVFDGVTDPVVVELGAAASRLLWDPAAQRLWVARARPRDVVPVDVVALLAGEPALGEPIPTPFAARDLALDAEGRLWAVTDRGLERAGPEGFQVRFSGRISAATALPAGLYGTAPVAVGTAGRVEITDGTGALLDGAAVGAVVRLAGAVLR